MNDRQTSLKARSFAKINLGIEIIGKRPDGYHEIRTLLQTIDFYDSLEFDLLERNAVELEGDDPLVPWDKNNLIFKAAEALKANTGCKEGVKIRVRKRIPTGKGLGGGSSNAAVVLYVLDKLWHLSLGKMRLKEIGSRLGADIPFFLEGGLCLGRGKGDQISPLADLDKLYCLLILPDFPIYTAEIYRHFTLTLKRKESKIGEFLKSRDFGLLENNLEETVFRFYPQLKGIKSDLSQRDSALALISGTGSAVYGLFFKRKNAEKARKRMGSELSSLIVNVISREEYWHLVLNGV